MALARWARTEEPTPGAWLTRQDLDEWLLPFISRQDTLEYVLER